MQARVRARRERRERRGGPGRQRLVSRSSTTGSPGCAAASAASRCSASCSPTRRSSRSLHVPGSVTPDRSSAGASSRRSSSGCRAAATRLPPLPAAVPRRRCARFDSPRLRPRPVARATAWPRPCASGPGALHLCYCFTPMRYVWDLYDDYFGTGARPAHATAAAAGGRGPAPLGSADRAACIEFVAISAHIADRIRRGLRPRRPT